MPIYEYVCKKCNKSFEALVRANDKPECPHCGSKQLSKQMSVPAKSSNTGSSTTLGNTFKPAPS